MVVAVLSGTMAPVSLIFATDKTITNKDLVLEKLRAEQSEKAGQLRDFDSDGKMKTFSTDESLKKSAEMKQPQKQNYVEGEVLVKFKEQKINLEYSSGRTKARQFANRKNLDKKEDIRKSNISVLKAKGDESVEGMVERLKNDPDVEYVQPNFLYYPLAIGTDDTYRDKLWGLDNYGQEVGGVSGTPNADINILDAWAILEGDEDDIIVAVIDSGVAYNHPDLTGNMWDGSNCLDDEGNYLGGCNHGYDYEDNDKIPLATISSHGTHIAGTIGAIKNNSKGIIGVAPNVKIMALKGLQILPTNHIVKGVNFAKHNGAKVINASWGNNADNCNDIFDQALYEAIQDFDGLFVAAAGNDGENHNGSTFFDGPSDYGYNTSCWNGLDNIISVAATDQNDNLAPWSDYGEFVDVGAPGVNIYSTTNDTDVLNETFKEIMSPNIPTGWTKGGTPNYWGTYDFEDDLWGKVLYGDYSHIPYENNVDSTVVLPSYNLSDATGVAIDFWSKCDTEYTTTNWYDYMALEISSDGVNYDEFFKWDEAYLDLLNDESPIDESGASVYHFQDIGIPSEYLTNNFKLRFRWYTDLSNYPIENYDGCFVDDVKITKYTDGSDEQYAYGYMQGTSMAAPHVAGLAALIWGYDSGLSYSEVKDVILTTGDPLDSLDGKTTTGKRINAFNALNSLISSGTEVSGNITEDTIWTLENSPYIVTGTVQVLEDIKLTIEPGVEVKFNENTELNIGGELNAIGTESQMITFTSNQDAPQAGNWIGMEFTDGSVDAQADDQNNYLSGSIIKYGVIEYAEDGIRSQNSSQYISNSIIRYNLSEGIQLYYSGSLLKNNIVSNNYIGIQFTNHDVLGDREFVIIGNQIINNSGDGIYGLQDTNATISHNDIYGNENGIDIVGTYTTPNINFNNIYNNSNYNVLMKYNNYEDVNAQNNWWGTTDAVEIENKLYDYYDDTNLGKVIYNPFATAELDFDDQTAPIITLLGTNPINLFVDDSYTDAGATALTYNVSDNAGNSANELTRTVNVNEVILENIEITNPAPKLIYTVGEGLDITGLEVTGTYNNGTTQIETITTANITGFDSSIPANDQILTITVNPASYNRRGSNSNSDKQQHSELYIYFR
jgi:subtilisin family serine protease